MTKTMICRQTKRRYVSFIKKENNTNSRAAQAFDGAEELFDSIREEFQSHEDISIKGSFTIAHDPLVSFRKRVQMTADEIWKMTGYRFT